MPLYHADVYMPQDVLNSLPLGVFQVEYTYHAKLASLTDKYGVLPLVSYLNFSQLNVIEIEHNGRELVKAVLRQKGQGKILCGSSFLPVVSGVLKLSGPISQLTFTAHSALKIMFRNQLDFLSA